MAGLGTECIPDACDAGACCELDGACTEDVLRVDCVEIPDAVFLGDASTCGMDTCTPDRGACCVDQGGAFTCEIRNHDDCDTTGLVYQGQGVPCDDTICELTACCLPGGGCQDLLASECLAAGGAAAEPGQSCAQTDFCTTGACCVDAVGSMDCVDDIALLVCEQAGGDFKGADSVCQPDTCDIAKGVCCLLKGVCDDNGGQLYFEDECVGTSGLNGVFVVANNCAWVDCGMDCGMQVNGDYDVDGDVDLVDFAAFQRCVGASDPDCLCPFDANTNGVIDAGDADGFIIYLEGSPLVALGVCCSLHGNCDDNGGALHPMASCTQPGARFIAAESCATAGCTDACNLAANYDHDGDGDVDLADLGGLQVCYGNDSLVDECLCPFDIEDSGMVDLPDVVAMTGAVGGPQAN